MSSERGYKKNGWGKIRENGGWLQEVDEREVREQAGQKFKESKKMFWKDLRMWEMEIA